MDPNKQKTRSSDRWMIFMADGQPVVNMDNEICLWTSYEFAERDLGKMLLGDQWHAKIRKCVVSRGRSKPDMRRL